MARDPSYIYAILAYSRTLNTTKRIFDEDSLLAPYTHTTQEQLAQQKAEAFASTLNTQRHKGATDWTAKIERQSYKPTGTERGAQIRAPRLAR